MASPRISLLVLSLALFICTAMSARQPHTVSVRVTNKIASSTIDVVCDHEADHININPESSHDWIVLDTSSKYYCDAVWTETGRFAGIKAYGKKFAGQKIVFWDAREDGWYVSRDGQNGSWKKKADWESEILN